MSARDSFIFYRSFYEASKKLPKEDKAEIFDAICSYALDGEEITLSVVPEAIFTVIKPNLDANRRRWKNGCKEKQTKSKSEAKAKQTKSKSEAKAKQEASKKEAISKQTESKDEANKDKDKDVNVNNNLKSKSEIIIPNFIDAALWNSFLEMRNSKKAKPTAKAIELIISKLTDFHEKGLDANESLKNSIESNWTGIFEPKQNQGKILTKGEKTLKAIFEDF